MRDFLDELCVVEKNNQSRTVLSGTLFRAYQQECQRNGQREIWSPAYFGKQLSERGFGSRKIDGQRCRTGISLKSEFVLKFDKKLWAASDGAAPLQASRPDKAVQLANLNEQRTREKAIAAMD